MSTAERTGRQQEGFSLLALPIAVKIALALGIVLLIGGIIMSGFLARVIGNVEESSTRREVQDLSMAQARRMADALDEALANADRFGRLNVIQDELRERLTAEIAGIGSERTLQTDAQMYTQVLDYDLSHEEIQGLTLVDANGIIIGSTLQIVDSDLPAPGDWPWFEQVSRGESYISLPDEETGLLVVSGVHIALPVVNEEQEGEFIGAVYALWNMSNLPRLAEVRGRNDLVVARDGTVILSDRLLPGDVISGDLLTSIMTAAPQGTVSYEDEEAIRWWYGYTALSELGVESPQASSLDWYVMAREPQAVVQAFIQDLVGQIRLAIGIVAIALTVLIAVFTYVLLRPLRRLTAAAARIQAGELDAPIPELPRDEIGNLADVLDELVKQLVSRFQQLSAATRVTRVASQTLELEELLNNTARAISTQFGYPEVRVYLLESGQREARLSGAAGEASWAMLEQGTLLEVDETTLVGRAILVGEAQIGTSPYSMQAGAMRTRLPEVALSLRAGGPPVGALQIIGDRDTVFEREDVDLLTLVADQLSVAVENARLYEQSQASLAEIETLNRRLTREAWSEFMSEGDSVRHTRDPQQRWPELMSDVRQRADAAIDIYEDADGRSVLAMPLLLRGEPIGTLAVTRPPGSNWSRDERLLVEAVGSRLTMLAESIRLVDESTTRALREQTVNEVSASLLQRAASVDGVLQQALTELSTVLGSDNVSLRIGRAPSSGDRPPDGNDPGGNGQGEAGE